MSRQFFRSHDQPLSTSSADVKHIVKDWIHFVYFYRSQAFQPEIYILQKQKIVLEMLQKTPIKVQNQWNQKLYDQKLFLHSIARHG